MNSISLEGEFVGFLRWGYPSLGPTLLRQICDGCMPHYIYRFRLSIPKYGLRVPGLSTGI